MTELTNKIIFPSNILENYKVISNRNYIAPNLFLFTFTKYSLATGLGHYSIS